MDNQPSVESEEIIASQPRSDDLEMNLSLVSSVTLARLVEEVKNEDLTANRYDRAHNRHNR
jgi:hypothetical protein